MLKAQWRRMALIAGGLGVLLAIGLAVVLTLAFTGNLTASAPVLANPPEIVPSLEPDSTGISVEPNPENDSEVDTSEPLEMTLDEFGGRTRYDDRFPLGEGMIWDQSYFAGEIFVANGYAFHDHEFKSQEGCVVVYYKALEGGGRIRFIGWDGMGFELNTNSGVSLNQAIAAMRETLVRAHGCNPDEIQYHRAVRHGDPVK